ncbi:hypothetical protein L208DRAFT_1298229, partial [Tricholoma matsutake]
QLHQCSVDNCLIVKDGQQQCKSQAPFPIATNDWMDAIGQWGPRHSYGYLNNWNPALLHCLHANHDVKLITNGKDTKDLSFYISNYTTKKQTKSSNTSVLLATRLVYHVREEKHNTHCVDVNKKFIQQCANTLTCQQEFSAPEVESYLMGWSDHFLLHNYVSIYWDTILRAVKRVFPNLQPSR